MDDNLSRFQESLLSSDIVEAKEVLSKISEGMTLDNLIETVIIKALENIGDGWQRGDYALSQIYMGGRICEELVMSLLPIEKYSANRHAPKMAIAMLNDYHALGKRIVYSSLRASGFDLLDYGRMDAEGLVDKIKKDKLDVILISVLMFPSALHIKDVKEMLIRQNLGNVKIVVGGAPFRFDRQLWQSVGADAVGYTASDAIKIIQSIVSGGIYDQQ